MAKSKPPNRSALIRTFLTEHPDMTPKQAAQQLTEQHGLLFTPALVSQVKSNSRGQIGMGNRRKATAGKALETFTATRAALKRKGKLPGDPQAVPPFHVELTVDERGLEIVLHNCKRVIGTLELTPERLAFNRGHRVGNKGLTFDNLANLADLFH
jgi:hypothetical protein